MAKTIAEWVKETTDNNIAKGWHETPKSDPELFCLIHSEISEALEEYRKGYEPSRLYYSESGKPEGIGIELADAVIRIFDYCGRHDLDLESLISTKHEFNKTRSHRHGGKVI